MNIKLKRLRTKRKTEMASERSSSIDIFPTQSHYKIPSINITGQKGRECFNGNFQMPFFLVVIFALLLCNFWNIYFNSRSLNDFSQVLSCQRSYRNRRDPFKSAQCSLPLHAKILIYFSIFYFLEVWERRRTKVNAYWESAPHRHNWISAIPRLSIVIN